MAGTYPYPYSLSLEGAEEALDLLLDSPPEMARTSEGNFIHGCAGAADPSGGGEDERRGRSRVRVFSDYI